MTFQLLRQCYIVEIIESVDRRTQSLEDKTNESKSDSKRIQKKY